MTNSSRVLRLTVALLCTLMLGAGCGSTGKQPVLDGTTWKLVSWAESGPIPASATITADFAEGRVTGQAGVNRYNAVVTSSADGSFSVGDAMVTQIAGPQEAMAAEAAYLKRLAAATSYAIDGDTLLLEDADGRPSLTFNRA